MATNDVVISSEEYSISKTFVKRETNRTLLKNPNELKMEAINGDDDMVNRNDETISQQSLRSASEPELETLVDTESEPENEVTEQIIQKQCKTKVEEEPLEDKLKKLGKWEDIENTDITKKGKSDFNPIIKDSDMTPEMQQKAFQWAEEALCLFQVKENGYVKRIDEKNVAGYIKKKFDRMYHPTWHCIVGKNFASYVTHQTECFTYFYTQTIAILLFKCPHNW